ncbi:MULTISPECIES: tryptophan-rich sensory protein [unclassified Leucobacter]|uniref:tryptophan-rich sensory protein n=1 Tax=unclassified Leucobacter TaxID=2621730 RepID=UPI00165D7834|nr:MULTISPECIES: tryptophan-rich sensory protein [unclassified Leucobacter]MBC9936003.1 tryptophan-rich sensory protein [Leucobacter sp. cx-87]
MNSRPEPSDRVRQVVVFVLALLAVAAAGLGSGAFGGTPVQDAAGGALAADATLIAPGTPAFSIWSVIYLGLLAYAVWQLAPAQAARLVQRRVGYLIAASMLLNAAWLGAIQIGQLWLSVAIIVVLLVVLARTLSLLLRTPRGVTTRTGAIVESVVLDGTVGLYLGWVTIASAANVAAWAVAAEFSDFGIEPTVWAVAALAIAACIGVATAIFSRGRLTPAIALSWGLCWVAIARLTDEPASLPVGIAACAAAGIVIVAAIATRLVAHRRSGDQSVA